MIQPRSLRFLHCTVFIVDSYKQWSAFLHSTRPGSSQEDIPKALVPAHRGFGIRGRFSSRWVLNGVAEDPQLARNFLEGGHRFAKTSLGYDASEPPRGVAWVALIRTQNQKVRTKMNFQYFILCFLDLFSSKKKKQRHHGSLDEDADENLLKKTAVLLVLSLFK